MPGTVSALAHGDVARAALIALLVGLALVVFGPPPGDLPAHLYRTELVQDGVLLWDTFWYAGHYPLLSYSLLYYFPAALLGNDVLAVVSVVVSAALFASLARREWGEAARLPTLVFAVVVCGSLYTGTYPYAAGLAAALGALKALQLGRAWVAVLLAALSLGFSPLAFLFLVVVALAAFLGRGARLDRQTVVAGAGLLALSLFQGVLLLVYPQESEYPFFRVSELLAVVGLCALCAALALRGGVRGRALALFFGLWAAAATMAFVVTSPIGENVTRPRGIVLPLALLAAALASFRPRWLAGLTVTGALAFTLIPYVGSALHRGDTRSADAGFWEPALRVLGERWTPDYRVEVVPTGDHWEAYWVPRAGFPIARGWYRQLDIAQNEVLYDPPLGAAAYREWLRSLGIRYVLLPETQLGRVGEEREGELIRSGRSGLVEVAQAGDVTVYEVPEAEPVLTGPADAHITSLGHDRIGGEVEAPGTYRLAVRWTPTWRVVSGDVCVEEAPDGMTSVIADGPTTFVLGVSVLPEASGCPEGRG